MTNAAAIGYMIKAALMAGFTHEQIRDIAAEMEERMDICTEEQAEATYRKF